MKPISYFSLLLMLLSNAILAQKVSVSEQTIPVDGREITAWVSTVGSDGELAKKTFKEFSKKILKLKPKNRGNTRVIAEEASLLTVSSKRGDFQGILVQKDNYYQMGIAFSLGYDISISLHEYPLEMTALKEVAINYLEFHYTALYDQRLEKKSKEIADLEKKLKQNQREITSLQSTVKRSQKKIYKTEDRTQEVKYTARIEQNRIAIKDLSLRQPALKHGIEKKAEELAEIKSEYENVLEQIGALRTETIS